MAQSKLIFYELNEVPKRVFEHFARHPRCPSLAKIHAHANKYVTHTSDIGHLSPWITWPTLHRGVTNETHEISDLGMDLTHVNRELPPIWDLLTKRGVKVGVFGSLHSYPLPKSFENYSFFVPDTFAAGPECFPQDLEAFQAFNISMVEQNALNVGGGIALESASNFLRKAPGLGLRGKTVGKITKQVVSERLNKDRLVRRRTSQTMIAFDFFLKALQKNRPDASFFFTNHVASSMHRYWPGLFPQDYAHGKFGDDWIERWSGEIPFAIREADQQIGALMDFCDRNPGYKLVITTSMGQGAVENCENLHSAVVVKNTKSLMQSLGLESNQWERRPSMSPQYNVWVEPQSKDRFKQQIAALNINGQYFDVQELGENVLRLEIKAENVTELEVEFQGSRVDATLFGIHNLHLQDAAGAYAYHIPEGLCLAYDPLKDPPADKAHYDTINTVQIAPSILDNFQIDRPRYMETPFAL